MLLIAVRPNVVSMLVYSESMSIVKKYVCGGTLIRLILLTKVYVSLM